MNSSGSGFLFIDDHFSPAGEAPHRLRDLIAGLRSGAIDAAPILGRLDPNLSDEVRALVAHRGVGAESFLAGVLMAFALDVADETWRRMTAEKDNPDLAEAAALGDLLARAMRQALEQGLRLEGETKSPASAARPGRRVG